MQAIEKEVMEGKKQRGSSVYSMILLVTVQIEQNSLCSALYDPLQNRLRMDMLYAKGVL